MTVYVIGQVIAASFAITDANGTAANASSASVTLTAPDGTTSTLSTTNPTTGTYAYTFTPSQAGRYTAREVTSGTNATSQPARQFDVWPSTPRLIISMADARAALNVSASVTTDDDEIQLYVAAATYVIEDICGTVLRTAGVVETFDGGREAVLLSDVPSSITSVVESGTTLSSSDYTANLDAGIVWAGGSTSRRYFTPGRQNVVVTYVAGDAVVPPNVVLAARELVRHSYQVGQQGAHPSFGGVDGDMAYTPSGFLVPKRVLEWCKPQASNRMPGIA